MTSNRKIMITGIRDVAENEARLANDILHLHIVIASDS